MSENAERILAELRKAGKITEKDIAEVGVVSQSTKKAVHLLHLTFCPFNHDTECSFAAEEQIDTGDNKDIWSKDAHQQWLRYTNALLDELGIQSEKFYLAFREAMSMMKRESKATLALLRIMQSRSLFWKAIGEKPVALCGPELSSGGEPDELADQFAEAFARLGGADSPESEQDDPAASSSEPRKPSNTDSTAPPASAPARPESETPEKEDPA